MLQPIALISLRNDIWYTTKWSLWLKSDHLGVALPCVHLHIPSLPDTVWAVGPARRFETSRRHFPVHCQSMFVCYRQSLNQHQSPNRIIRLPPGHFSQSLAQINFWKWTLHCVTDANASHYSRAAAVVFSRTNLDVLYVVDPVISPAHSPPFHVHFLLEISNTVLAKCRKKNANSIKRTTHLHFNTRTMI